MKKVYFLKNKVFRKDDNDNLILNRAGKRIFRRDIGYAVAKELEAKLGMKIRITDDDTLIHNYDSVAINWGRSKGQNLYNNIFNDNYAIKNSVKKDRSYSILELRKCKVPAFTLNKEGAFEIWKKSGLVVREVVDGKGGEGVKVILKNDKTIKTLHDIPDAPLYTAFFNKTHEARYHIAFGEVLQVVEKKKMGKARREENGIAVDPHVRNHDNGWIHVKNDVNPALNDRMLKTAAVNAVQALGLVFGAVDMMVILSEFNELCDWAITEVNTAPGVEGSTMDAYTSRFADFIKSEL